MGKRLSTVKIDCPRFRYKIKRKNGEFEKGELKFAQLTAQILNSIFNQQQGRDKMT